MPHGNWCWLIPAFYGTALLNIDEQHQFSGSWNMLQLTILIINLIKKVGGLVLVYMVLLVFIVILLQIHNYTNGDISEQR
jgi:hypothetical protein